MKQISAGSYQGLLWDDELRGCEKKTERMRARMES
jgi:hypothetical protein